MYPAQFDYYRADSVSDALDLLNEHADAETELLAGGHSLLPTMKTGLASPDIVIDIGQIDALTGIEPNGDTLSVGANTRYATIADSDAAREHAPAFTESVAAVGDIQVRNRGTIGGNIAHSDPAGDPPAGVLASDASIIAEGPDGERPIPVDDYFVGMYTTGLEEDEILTRIDLPSLGPNDVGAYAKKPSPSSGYAMVGVAVVLRTDGETIDVARVAANGAVGHATRLEGVEEVLVGEPVSDAPIDAVSEHATDGMEDWELLDDIQASSDYRAQLLKVYTQRAVSTALDRV